MTLPARLRAGMAKGGQLVPRAWGVGDQAFSSLTNFALGVLIANAVTSDEFGVFSLVFATYTLLLGLSRALATEPLMVRVSHGTPEAWRAATAAATGTAMLIGSVGAVGCLLFAFASGGTLHDGFLALGLALPGLLLQDAWRFAFFARGTGEQAFLNDVMWAVVMFAVVGALVATAHGSLFWLTLTWGGAGALAGAYGLLQARLRPRLSQAPAWLRQQADLAPHFAGEFAAMSGARQLAFYAVGAIAGVAAAGAIRGAQLLLGPVQVLHNGVRLVAIPDTVRAARTSVARVRGICRRISIALGGVTAAWGAVLVLLPDRLGVLLLADTWSLADQVALPMGLMFVAGGVSTGAVIGLRALAAGDRSFGTRVVVSAVQVVAAIAGAVVAGAVGAAWGLALGVWIAVPIWQWQLHRAIVEREPGVPVPSAVGLPGAALAPRADTHA